MMKENFDEILALATKIDQLARDIDPYGYDDAVSDWEENISQVAEAMAETFGFLEAEVAAMEVDFEQGEIDREVQAWQIAEAIQKGNLAPIEAFLQASIDEGIEETSEEQAKELLAKLAEYKASIGSWWFKKK